MTLENKLDPMDRYSKPTEIQETKLGKIFSLKPRENPDKPGRSLRVLFDKRFPLIEGFEPQYMYSVSFDEAGNEAGNHYHQKKSELFYVVSGNFDVYMEDPNSKEREVINLDSKEHKTFYVKAGIAHKVRANIEGSVLLVVATASNVDGDEFHYEIQSQKS